jgi:UDP-GlcNAc:undecaprenyl-phosphate/decaprenyl-phosphate GlcNAc-1-phosphate transferase
MKLFVILFFISAVLTLLLTPLSKLLALKVGAVDKPSERKIHKNIIPRFGGVPIFISFVMAYYIGIFFAERFGIHLLPKEINALHGVFLGSLIMVLIGVIDDMWGLSPLLKFAGQVIAACVAVYFGTQINYLSTPFTHLVMLGAWSIPLTVLWMVTVTNAMNLIDGLDGLATGILVIASAALFIVALKTNQMDAAILLIALCGTGVGFLRFNFFPASIFLGDSGALFFGFMLACASVVGVLKSALVIALIVPVAVLAVPIFDTAAVIIRRAIDGTPIFQADKRHLHHRLLKAGFDQKQVVFIIYVACIILSLAALAATVFDNYPALITLSVFVVLGVIFLDTAKDILRNIAFRSVGKK